MFALGLCLVLFISWQAIEYKTYERQYDLESLNVEDDDDEEIPITEQIKTPPPPPPPRNTKINNEQSAASSANGLSEFTIV